MGQKRRESFFFGHVYGFCIPILFMLSVVITSAILYMTLCFAVKLYSNWAEQISD